MLDEVTDSIYKGEIKPVIVQSDAPYRMQPENIKTWFAKNNDGEMVPFSSFTTTEWVQGAASQNRLNSIASVSISGTNAAGVSSGDAMDKMEKLVPALMAVMGLPGLSY